MTPFTQGYQEGVWKDVMISEEYKVIFVDLEDVGDDVVHPAEITKGPTSGIIATRGRRRKQGESRKVTCHHRKRNYALRSTFITCR